MAFQLQLVFSQYDAKRQRLKQLKDVIIERLAEHSEYTGILHEERNARERRKSIENQVLSEFSDTADEIEKLKLDIKQEEERMADGILTLLTEGKDPGVVHGSGGRQYRPGVKCRMEYLGKGTREEELLVDLVISKDV